MSRKPEAAGEPPRPHFVPGDVVELASGGFPMTVVSHGCCGDVEVSWCRPVDQTIGSEAFPAECLVASERIPF